MVDRCKGFNYGVFFFKYCETGPLPFPFMTNDKAVVLQVTCQQQISMDNISCIKFVSFPNYSRELPPTCYDLVEGPEKQNTGAATSNASGFVVGLTTTTDL